MSSLNDEFINSIRSHPEFYNKKYNLKIRYIPVTADKLGKLLQDTSPDTLIIKECRLDNMNYKLPDTIRNLQLSDNRLTELSHIPPGLDFFDCSGNKLERLDGIPDSLRILICHHNPLSSITFNNYLSANLRELYCSKCSLTELPMLPHTLEKLNCSENKALANLPSLPVTLEYLDCSGCVLTNLQDFLIDSELKVLNCMSNKITRLPQLPNKLVKLKCAYNRLLSLPTPLPNELVYLECSYNQLINLPTPLPDSLMDLISSHNQLTYLPSPLPANMDTLHTAANKLSWLPELPSKLSELDCQDNMLTIFPNPVPITLTWLDCRDNPMLKWLPILSVNMSYMWQDNISLPVNEYEDLVDITPEIMEYVNMENERLFNKWLCDRLAIYRAELLERQAEITLNPDRIARLIQSGELGALGTWGESLS